MPVSALVITLPEAPEARSEALAWLERDARLTLGPRDGRRLAVVAETHDERQDALLFESLLAWPGLGVDLVSYDFSDLESVTALPERRRRAAPEEGGPDGAA